jgi:cell division protein FtsL
VEDYFYQEIDVKDFRYEDEQNSQSQIAKVTIRKVIETILYTILTVFVFFVSAFIIQVIVSFIPGLSESGPAGFSVPNIFGLILTIILALTISIFFYRARKTTNNSKKDKL